MAKSWRFQQASQQLLSVYVAIWKRPKCFFSVAHHLATSGDLTLSVVDKLREACAVCCPWVQRYELGLGIKIAPNGAVIGSTTDETGQIPKSLYMWSMHASVPWSCFQTTLSIQLGLLWILCTFTIKWMYYRWSLMEWKSFWLRRHWVHKTFQRTHRCLFLACRSFGIHCIIQTQMVTESLGGTR